MSLLRAAATVSSLTLLSRITGLVRDVMIARVDKTATSLHASVEKAGAVLTKQHATKNKRRLQRIAILESRLAAL